MAFDNASVIRLGAVGDVFLNRDAPESAFDDAVDLFRTADLVFGNCEGAFTDSPDVAPSAGLRVASGYRNGRRLGRAGFNVMALANNHAVDAGYRGLLDTIALLKSQRIAVVGAGETLDEARRPHIATVKDRRIAFLSFSTVYRDGYEARSGRPGISALRVHSLPYHPVWDIYAFEPGAAPHMRTFPFPEDLALFQDCVARAREAADIVCVSMHWGDSRLPFTITDYEAAYGRAAIDAGADIVLGHHHHFVKGVEFYRGKPIFYGLGHFVFDLIGLDGVMSAAQIAALHRHSEYSIFPRPDSPGFPFHPDARHTFALFADFGSSPTPALSLAPFEISPPENSPRFVEPRVGAGAKVVDYLRKCCASAGFRTRFVEGEAILGRSTVRVEQDG